MNQEEEAGAGGLEVPESRGCCSMESGGEEERSPPAVVFPESKDSHHRVSVERRNTEELQLASFLFSVM